VCGIRGIHSTAKTWWSARKSLIGTGVLHCDVD
jgi:hypothetical protein